MPVGPDAKKQVGVLTLTFIADETALNVPATMEKIGAPRLEQRFNERLAAKAVDDDGIKLVAIVVVVAEDDGVVLGSTEDIRL